MIIRIDPQVAAWRPRFQVVQQSVPNMLSAAQVAENYFLESRHMLLEVAAHFDRYDAAAARESGGTANGRAAAGQGGPGSMARLREAIAILAAPHADRERTVALLELFARD
jgi:hypothetical protein